MRFRQFLEQVNLDDPNGFDSRNLYNEMAVLAPSLRAKLGSGVGWIMENAIRCCLVGGAAVVHYVTHARPLTPDMDFITEHIEEVVQRAKNSGLTIEPISAVADPPLSGVTLKEFDLDFLDANSWNSQLHKFAIRTAQRVLVGGISVPVVSPEVLTIMKFSTLRDKDESDAFLLLQSGTFSKQDYKSALQAVKSFVPDARSMWSYATLIPH